MPQRITFNTVRQIGLALPDVEESTMYGSPALKVRGKAFTCIPIHPSAEPDSLALFIDIADRDELIAADPETYYVKDHYEPYPVVLVRLKRVHVDALRDLLQTAWKRAAARAKRPARPTKRRR
jgi:hypothetical protein